MAPQASDMVLYFTISPGESTENFELASWRQRKVSAPFAYRRIHPSPSRPSPNRAKVAGTGTVP